MSKVYPTARPDETAIGQALREQGWSAQGAVFLAARLPENPAIERTVLRRLVGVSLRRRRHQNDRGPVWSARVKAAVWSKTDGRCHYCGTLTNPFDDFTIDHIVPRAKGGSDDLDNLAPCCRRCNASKGARDAPSLR